MSYLALARKYRPRRFEDVLGQNHAVQALRHALGGDRLHPAILLTGTRGVGKTTLGRIIAKGLNCETGVTATPCGICSSCREIDEGRFVDLLEIDAASRTKVDDTRALLDNIQYSPVRGRYKVYLIDEVHMLSNASFNALLKTLEEPPPHVKFILATTDPQKLPVTVLSRCLQFGLKRLTPALIREALAEVLRKEAVEFEPGATTEIARAADGSMRDALSLLDQAIAFSGGSRLEREPVEAMLGGVGREVLIKLLAAVADRDGVALLGVLKILAGLAPDYSVLLTDIAALLQRAAVLQLLPTAADEDDEPSLVELAQRLPPEDVQVCYQISVLGRRDLPWAPDSRMGFEMTLLRMLAFRAEDEGEGASVPAAAPQSRSPNPPNSPTPASAMPTSRPTAVAAPPVAPSAPAPAATSAPVATKTPAPAPVAAQPRVEAAAPSQVAEPAVAFVVDPATLSTVDLWDSRIEQLGLDAISRLLARHCAWGEEAPEGTVRMLVEQGARGMLKDDRRRSIEQALSRLLGRPMLLKMELAPEGVTIDSPIQSDRLRADQRQKDAVAALDADPDVREFRRLFGAEVRPGSVQPID